MWSPLYIMALFSTWCLKKSCSFWMLFSTRLAVFYTFEAELVRMKVCWTILLMGFSSPCWPSQAPPPLCSHAVLLPTSPSLCPPWPTVALRTFLLLFPSLSQILLEPLQLVSAQTSKNATKTPWYGRAIHHLKHWWLSAQTCMLVKCQENQEK